MHLDTGCDGRLVAFMADLAASAAATSARNGLGAAELVAPPAVDGRDRACKAGTVRTITGHAGQQTLAALRSFGVDTMFTLNGGHVWPFYDAARDQGVRIVDTRHEQTATFAAEAYAKLTRSPGLAVLTAGPGITNGVSAITTAWFNGSPLVVLGDGRRRGAGAPARCRSSTTCRSSPP